MIIIWGTFFLAPFHQGLGVVIALNSVTIGLETDSVAHAVATQEEHDDRLWYIVELIFCGLLMRRRGSH